MINLNLIQKEPHEVIGDVLMMYNNQVKTLLDMGFIFDYVGLSFEGNFVIGKETYKANIFKTINYFYLSIYDSNNKKIDEFSVYKEEKEDARDINFRPILSYLLIFKKKMEDKEKKSFSEYVKSEKA